MESGNGRGKVRVFQVVMRVFESVGTVEIVLRARGLVSESTAGPDVISQK